MEVETPLANKDGRLSGLAVSPGWASSCGRVVLYRADCREVLPTLARPAAIITDPPYGISFAAQPTKWQRLAGKQAEAWDDATVPDVVLALPGIAPLCVVWGGNYFPLPCSRGWIIWDKRPMPPSFASCELAWTSFDRNAATWNGKTGNETPVAERIHPTQKPVALYDWLLANYAKPGQRVLDTHLGSGSHAIAAHYFGAHLTACEIDADYYAAAMARIQRETAQTTLFT